MSSPLRSPGTSPRSEPPAEEVVGADSALAPSLGPGELTGPSEQIAPELSFGPAEWSAFLSDSLGMPIRVSFGRARRQVLVAKPSGTGWSLRLNAGFGRAPLEVREAVAQWMRSGRRARRASRILDDWIEELSRTFAANPKRLPPLRPVGSAHDLTLLFERMCREALTDEELEGLGEPALSWGRATKRAQRSLQLGSFDAELRLIRIHPVLDQHAVPSWFVAFVLFHEALHGLYPPRAQGRRTLHHPPEFLARERKHPDHERANAWQSATIGALLRSAKTGRPLPAPRRSRGPVRLLQRLLFDTSAGSD